MLDPVTDHLLAEAARDKLKVGMNDHVKALMDHVCSNPILLNEIVACGPYDFRVKFIKAMRPLPVDETLANMVYAFFEQKTGGRYAATRFLDGIEITVETEAERQKRIDDAWMLTSHSSEAAKRKYGLPSGTGPMKLKDLRSMLTISDIHADVGDDKGK